MATWLSNCEEQNIETTENYNLITILADPYEIRMWNIYGLPRDQVSIENAIFVTHADRWPLMIDPQEQVVNFYIKLIKRKLLFIKIMCIVIIILHCILYFCLYFI